MIIDPFHRLSAAFAKTNQAPIPPRATVIGHPELANQTKPLLAWSARLPLPELATAACRAVQVAASDSLIASLVPQLRQFSQRFPQASPMRLARVVTEAELRGQALNEQSLAAVLGADGFGLEPVSPAGQGNAGPGGDGQSGFGQGGRHRGDNPADQPGLVPPLSGPNPPLQPEESGGGDFFGLLGRKAPGRRRWQWYSIGPTAWSSGGSLRIADDPRDSAVNLDISTPEGMWQFHWCDPQRRVLFCAPPPGQALTDCPKLAMQSFLSQINPLGFEKVTEIGPNDWYDGFTYLALGNIIKRVDLLG